MESCLGIQLEQFVAVGGATASAFWMQNKADVTGRVRGGARDPGGAPSAPPSSPGIGVGLYRDEQEAFERVWKPGKTYQPDAKLSARYAKWFDVYRQLYPALRPINHQPASQTASDT
jgi:sugar (pentulose or hexulose) kinase